MVKQYLLIMAACLLLAACNSNNNNAAADVSENQGGTAGVSAADVTKGEEVPLESVRFDTLRLHVKAGDRFSYRIRMYSAMTQDTNEVVKDEELLVNEAVSKVAADGNAVLRVKYKEMKVKATFRNAQTKAIAFETQFNSTNEKDKRDSTKQQFAVMLDVPIDITVTPKAFMKDITGVDAIARKIAATGPGGQQGGLPPEQFSQLRDMIKETMVATFMATTLAPLPDSTLSADGAWTRHQNQSMNPIMSSKSTTTFKVKAVKKVNGHRLAIVEGNMIGSVEIKPAPEGMQAPQFKVSQATIKGTSTIVVDLDTGVLISNKADALSVIEATMTFQGGAPRRILQKQELRVDTELLP